MTLTANSRLANLGSLASQKPWILIIPVLLVSAGLGFYKLGAESLWIDELYSVYDALLIDFNPLEIVSRFAQVRPIYYLLLRFWTLLGQDEIWLRTLSVLFGVGSVFLTYHLGRKISGITVGIVAALMLALSPMSIYFSQMVRMYGLGMFFGLLGSLFLALALEMPKTKYFAGWAIARSLVFLTAPLNITLLVPDLILLGLTFRQRPQMFKEIGKWLLLICILCLPSVSSLVADALPFLKKALGLVENVAAAQKTTSFNLPLDLFRKVRKFTVFPFPSTSVLESRILQAYTLVMVSVMGVAFYKNRNASRIFWAAAWVFIPWFVHGAVSSRMLFDRYVFYTTPYLLILLAAGLARVARMHRVVATIIAIAYAIIVIMGISRYYTVQDRQDWRGLFEFVNQNEQPDDVIVYSMELVNPDKFSSALKYYHKGDAAMINIRELCENRNITTPAAILELQQVTANLDETWLLCGSGFNQDKFQTVLADYGQLEGHWQFVNHAFYRQEDYMNLFKIKLNPKN